MTTYVLAVLTKVRKEVIETHKVKEVQEVKGSTGDMAPIDIWQGAR
jgi:hypothetical protein